MPKSIEVKLECPACMTRKTIEVSSSIGYDVTCPNCTACMNEVIEFNEEVDRTEMYTKERSDILNEAHDIINGERQDSYGNPEDSFKIIAEFWSTYIKYKFGLVVKLSNLDTAHMMSLFKHARMLGQKPVRDNYTDACGYLAIAADRLLKKQTN